MLKGTPKRTPFAGGANKSIERALINAGYSDKNNLRDMHPGFITRDGQSRLHSTTDSAQEVISLYQYKDRAGNISIFSQRADGSVHQATNNPPTTTTGNFGSEVLAALAGTIPASWSVKDSYLYFSDGKRHMVYSGANQQIGGFHVYKGAAAIPVIPEIGEDYTEKVTDSSTSRVAVLNSLNTLAAYQFFAIRTEVPCNSLTFTMVNTNGTVSTLAGQYWKSDGTWASLTITDGTKTGGNTTLGQSGAVTWTHPSDEIPHYQFGQTGYWYRFNVSVQIDSSVSVSQVVYSGAWNAMVDVWDGSTVPSIEAQVYRVNSLRYETYAGTSIDISNLFGQATDYAFFNSFDNICGFHIDCEGTPNIIKATITGSSDINLVDSGTTGDDWIEWSQAGFQDAGFEEGMAIAITNSVSNDKTVTAKAVTSNRIYVATGTFTTAESGISATLTFDNTSSNALALDVWTGAGWTAITTNLNDGTTTASKSGWVTFPRPTTAQKTQFNGSVYFAYWFRFRFGKATSKNAVISISTMPYQDIADWGLGYCSTTWNGRPVIAQDKYCQWIDIGAMDRTSVFNGADYAPFEVGDNGRSNKVVAMIPFWQDLMVFQEESGIDGGCITLVQGYQPKAYGKLVVSNKIGAMNAKSVAMVEGVKIPNNPRTAYSKLVYFISKNGVFYTDGTTGGTVNISGDMQLYFDPLDTTNCIRDGYENKHWLKYDSAYKCLRIGLCTGSSATVANTFLVYDIEDQTWGTDTLGQALTCMAEIEAASGNITVLQIGGSSDGFVYRLNTGLNDVGSSTVAVNSYVVIEIDGQGNKVNLSSAQIRCKSQTAGSLVVSYALEGNTSYTAINGSPLVMQASTANDTYRRNDFSFHLPLIDHLSLKIAHNTVSEEVYLLDFSLLDAEGKNVFQS